MGKKATEKYQAQIDDAMELINTQVPGEKEEKKTAKMRRAYARTQLETIMEKKRLCAELSDTYDYFEDI